MCIFSCKYKPAGFKLEQILQLCYKIGSQVERKIINHVAVWSVWILDENKKNENILFKKITLLNVLLPLFELVF